MELLLSKRFEELSRSFKDALHFRGKAIGYLRRKLQMAKPKVDDAMIHTTLGLLLFDVCLTLSADYLTSRLILKC